MAAKPTSATTDHERATSRLLIMTGLAALALAFAGPQIAFFDTLLASPLMTPTLIGTALICFGFGVYPLVRPPTKVPAKQRRY